MSRFLLLKCKGKHSTVYLVQSFGGQKSKPVCGASSAQRPHCLGRWQTASRHHGVMWLWEWVVARWVRRPEWPRPHVNSLHQPSALCPQHRGCKFAWSCLTCWKLGCWVFELRSSHLCGKPSYPLRHTPPPSPFNPTLPMCHNTIHQEDHS